MKIFTFITALLLLVGSASYGQISDGGFEAGAGSGAWVEASTNYGTPLCTEADCGTCGGPCIPYAGTVYAWFGGANALEVGSVEQTAIFPAGTVASVDLMLHMPMPGPGLATDKFEVMVDGTVLHTITALDSAMYQSAYTALSVDVSAMADGASHTLKLVGTQSTATVFNVLVDDVDLIVDGSGSGVFDDILSPTAISVYPNPATDIINLDFRDNKGLATITIYTIKGEVVSSEQIDNVMHKTYTYSTSNMNNGVYIVKVECGERVIQERIVIAK